MLAAGCEKVKGLRWAIFFVCVVVASYASPRAAYRAICATLRSPRAAHVQSIAWWCRSNAALGPLLDSGLPERQRSCPLRVIWLGELRRARTTGPAAAGAKLRKLAFVKPLAIADPVQETCGDRGAVKIRAYSYERPGAASVPISQRRGRVGTKKHLKQGKNAIAATI